MNELINYWNSIKIPSLSQIIFWYVFFISIANIFANMMGYDRTNTRLERHTLMIDANPKYLFTFLFTFKESFCLESVILALFSNVWMILYLLLNYVFKFDLHMYDSKLLFIYISGCALLILFSIGIGVYDGIKYNSKN